jgi:hypothetical protein
MGMKKVAIAAANCELGIPLSAQMNRETPDGEFRYGIPVLRPGCVMTGSRWDLILVAPLAQYSSYAVRTEYLKWVREVLPTKLASGGEIIYLHDQPWAEMLRLGTIDLGTSEKA